MEERRRAPGELEQEVLVVLSSADRAWTPSQVREAIAGDLAYTTVMTVLARLYEKGFVHREPVGRGYAYRWVDDGVALTARQMSRLLDGVDDRAAVLARFVEQLSPADEQVLSERLRRLEQP